MNSCALSLTYMLQKLRPELHCKNVTLGTVKLVLTNIVNTSLTAAFDTVDHDILLHCLEHTFGFQGTALAWVRSYLSGRTQTVSIDGKLSSPTTIHCDVSQGCVLGSILFILYTQPLSCVIGNHPVSHQLYADDTQTYSSSSPSEIGATIHNKEKYICDVKSWMICNKLQMNHDKTETIVIATQWTNMSHALPSSLHINGIPIEFSKSLRNLGLFLTTPFHYTSIS